MGKATTHRLSDQVIALGRPLARTEQATLERSLRALLGWQHTLAGFPRLRGIPNATPYVSLYARGSLRGCYGLYEGAPGERLVRAFLLALADTRYGGIAPKDWPALAADVAFIRRARPVRADEAGSLVEAGVHGVARVDAESVTVLLPSAAREKGLDANAVLDALAKKANLPRSDEGIVWLLEVDDVSSRGLRMKDAQSGARSFLESLVAADGAVAFEVDAGTGQTKPDGPMRYGRIAVAIEALRAVGSAKGARATRWLVRELARGFRDERPDVALGTLALAARAGLDVPLASLADGIDVAACSPWHAAQAASVLGSRTPKALWDACVRSLDARPLAPYTLMAARLRGDGAVVERCASALESSIRKNPPFVGGAAFTPIPETALTAVSVEALAGLPGARQAIRRARAFVLARQIAQVPAAMHPGVLGAFRASPIAPILRCDIAGHALLAIAGNA